MMGGSKRKSAIPSCGEAGKITAEAFPSSKKKKALLALCARLLPDDMMLEVLLRLPVKSILRFRVVCRAWAALLSSKDFCSLHLATCKVLPPAPKLLVVSPTEKLDSATVCSYSPSGPRDDLLFTIDSARPNSVEVLTPSPCCGLTLLYDAAALAYYVCNAATRAVARLPPYCDRARDFTAGLGFDAPTREYKVVRLINGLAHEDILRCEVYTPGADCWRPAAGGVPFRWSKFAHSAVGHAMMSKIQPVFANGFLHWLISPSLLIRRPRAAIILFSVAEETFGSIRSPPFWGSREHVRPWSESEGEHLVVMDDQVCFVRNLRNGTPHGSALEIWGLLDYGSGDWTLNHRIDLSGHIRRELGEPQAVRVIGSLGNCRSGKKIVIATSKHWVYEKFHKKVYTYDPSCQVLEGILSVTETHTSVPCFIPGSRFSLFEESLAPVHKRDEEVALSSTLAKATKETTTSKLKG